MGGPKIPEAPLPPRYEVEQQPFSLEQGLFQAQSGGRQFERNGNQLVGRDAFGNPFNVDANFGSESSFYRTFMQFDQMFVDQSHASGEAKRASEMAEQEKQRTVLQREINQLESRGAKGRQIGAPRGPAKGASQSPRIGPRSRGQFLGIGSLTDDEQTTSVLG